MSRLRTMLDVDPTIVERNLLIVDKEDDEFNKLFPVNNSDIPSKLVKPIPGFCVKTRTTNNAKVFINICQTDAIPAPDNISDVRLLEILESDTPTEFRVPMSIGEARAETDKAGQAATAYDVAINPQFFQKVENNQVFKHFLLVVILEGIQDKYGIELKINECTVLKNKKAHGQLQCHRIQQRDLQRNPHKPQTQTKKLIEELDTKTEPIVTNNNVEPAYKLVKTNEEFLIGDFYLPNITSVEDILLDVGEDRIVLECKKGNYFLDIFLPCLIQPDIKARFNRINHILTVKMPILKVL